MQRKSLIPSRHDRPETQKARQAEEQSRLSGGQLANLLTSSPHLAIAWIYLSGKKFGIKYRGEQLSQLRRVFQRNKRKAEPRFPLVKDQDGPKNPRPWRYV